MLQLRITLIAILGFNALHAQSPTDGLMMPKRQLCVLAQYSNSSWENYWQGTLKRSNSNIGRFTGQNVMLMANYGITGKLNVMAGAPYVWTRSSASYLAGQKGIQDLSLFVKYQVLEKGFGKSRLKIQATGGLSSPLTNYTGDFLPFCLGLHCKAASLRAIVNFSMDPGMYVTAQAGHTWRGNTKLDRDAYIFDNQLVYSDEMPVPNVLDYTFRLGFLRERWQAEVFYDAFTGLSGDDIRYNEAPQATNKMAAAQAGLWVKVFPTKHLGVQAGVSKVLSGRNTGEALNWNVGATYFFTLPGGKSKE